MSADEESYLSLSAASKLLGVHSTTLRRWADAGTVPVYLTPGGHRRFVRADLLNLALRRGAHGPTLNHAWATQSLVQAHADVAATSPRPAWITQIDEPARAAWRSVGQQLMGVVLHYLNTPHDDAELLAEARRIGGEYAHLARHAHMPLTVALEAALFFRDALVDAALQISEELQPPMAEHARLLRRLNQIANEVQLAVASHYE
ncbi:MerR family transcriptional regulator [Candidatus Viridilinea mediisalina]|uniref:DNA-binding protein n=1 Tax=Candidatus Viridilinea mediisalina TaxID=2024553 RepID=A0A2A6RJA5_9CHLR|nr:helix-turn-helix domain-containing protein [Candidatus Viridilinea mediisalina]PDW03021.1 DNA-binding protein [Candidatus Viridilinea mediisalina]